MENLGVIILAGGKSSRMGEDKGLMPLFGKPMISYVLDVARTLSNDITIVADNSNYKKFEHKLVKDIYKEKGPLSGIYSGLKKAIHEKNVVLSCDIPYIKVGLLKFLLYQSDGYDITVPSHNERIHPLIGVYKKRCSTIFRECIESEKLKITEAYKLFKTNIVDTPEFDDIEFKNLNSKKDIIPLG